MSQSNQQSTNVLDTFDHVVVLMLENRSFDNLLGYLYSQEYPVPPGNQFEGVDGKNLSNPIPSAYQFTGKNGERVTEVRVAPNSPVDYHRPFPDPGEDYPHVNTQLFNPDNQQPFNKPPYNLPSPLPKPPMSGFVSDYIANYVHNEFPNAPLPSPEGFYDNYRVIMECYQPADISVLSGLAREFAVFDHWFCSVPSETICNRNFWHSGTSWGHVINPGPGDDKGDEDNKPNTEQWFWDTLGLTIFNQLQSSNWKIYSDNKIPLPEGTNLSFPVTPLIHFWAFAPLLALDRRDMFDTLDKFKSDCASGTLPAYSFIEPNFFNPHNDMHPSTPGEIGDGPQANGSVLLGDALVCDIYNAIFTSPNLWNNTLLIITFDEHGGCYDHVTPPGQYGEHVVEPIHIAIPPNLCCYKEWDGFDFKRLGLRVPTIMVSPYIKKNTIINKPMSHTSFLKTMHEKWGLPSLSRREDASPGFHDTGLFCPTLQRADISQMPIFAAPIIPVDKTDYSEAVLSALAKAIISLFTDLWCKAFPEHCPTKELNTQGEVATFLGAAVAKAKSMLRPADALAGQEREIKDHDWMLLLQAVAEEMKRKRQPVRFRIVRLFRQTSGWLMK
jgi:phospholipase C